MCVSAKYHWDLCKTEGALEQKFKNTFWLQWWWLQTYQTHIASTLHTGPNKHKLTVLELIKHTGTLLTQIMHAFNARAIHVYRPCTKAGRILKKCPLTIYELLEKYLRF